VTSGESDQPLLHQVKQGRSEAWLAATSPPGARACFRWARRSRSKDAGSSFATRELAHSFLVGTAHDPEEQGQVFNRAADFSGISEDLVRLAHGRVPFGRFACELLKSGLKILGVKVLIAHGYYDMITPYFSSERLVEQMKLLPQQREKLFIRHFGGGHMFYTWEESRRAFRDWARSFYASP
jgi:pimeloyl-ACP methyl ester carboxylesterase